MLAMADETSRDTLLSRVKEQGELVRRLKAAKVDNTQVRELNPSNLFLSSGKIPGASSARDRCTSFLLSPEEAPHLSALHRAQLHRVIMLPSLTSAKSTALETGLLVFLP